MVIDARTPVWTTAKKGGTIKGSEYFFLPNPKVIIAKTSRCSAEILTSKFGVTEQDGIFNFTKAKTLYLFLQMSCVIITCSD
ncbi:MAG: hypothetical protein H0A76_13485 [Candidatus Thiodubiliella endoseptemdiera]|uniref:Uncharacterized protein n=1 Tax=Candidatus Thiodubiliella endoseptemdiera TaxID=2738886 RepID=A0A853F9F0_9GAMM|nr:hypothetical protein [Candidatus Thiodubiliella endoseptemdiera]